MDTLGVGTRSAIPLILPFMLGMTRATALAAPVVVGTMFRQAARARRSTSASDAATDDDDVIGFFGLRVAPRPLPAALPG